MLENGVSKGGGRDLPSLSPSSICADSCRSTLERYGDECLTGARSEQFIDALDQACDSTTGAPGGFCTQATDLQFHISAIIDHFLILFHFLSLPIQVLLVLYFTSGYAFQLGYGASWQSKVYKRHPYHILSLLLFCPSGGQKGCRDR